jgi:hypothetical protein
MLFSFYDTLHFHGKVLPIRIGTGTHGQAIFPWLAADLGWPVARPIGACWCRTILEPQLPALHVGSYLASADTAVGLADADLALTMLEVIFQLDGLPGTRLL